jgi:N-methylhydantoinase B
MASSKGPHPERAVQRPSRRTQRTDPATPEVERFDPVTVSLVQHRLLAIVAETGEAMLRTAYSQILNSSRDFSTAICDLDGRLLAQAEHVPIHVGALPYAAQAVAGFFAADIRPGDVFILNDPYHGGNHLPDLTVFVPVFAGDEPRFWSINRAHQSDIGGAAHGAYNAAATEIWQEGLRIPPLRLYDAGALRRDMMEMLVLNVRHARDFKGDLAAMVGSAHLGERRLRALVREFGWPVLEAAIEAVLGGAERRARAVISAWRDGVYRGEALLDDDGRGNDDIAIRACVEKRGSDLLIDLSESHREVASFVNSSYANMRAAVVVAISYLIDPDTPKNDGAFRPITVTARPVTVVWANPPMPVTLATNHCGQEIIEAIVKALAPACPDRVMAGWGRRFRIAIEGRDPRDATTSPDGKPFIWHFFQARPGGGASSAGDGWPGVGEWQAAGGIMFGSLEVTEARFPLFFRRHEFRSDSGGAGRFRGGPGAIAEIVVETETPCLANTAGDGVRHGACGRLGGADGLPHRYTLHSEGYAPRPIKTKETGLVIRPGDVLVLESGGGGGSGDPAARDEVAIARDREDGFVTAPPLVIETARLRLRGFEEGDLTELVSLVGDWEVARWLSKVPHPYGETDGRAWIGLVRAEYAAGRPRHFAIAMRDGDRLIGCIGLDDRGGGPELGYWLGRPHWGNGCAKEAVAAVIDYAFGTLGLEAIGAHTDPENIGSQRVLLYCGLEPAGEIELEAPSRNSGARRAPWFRLSRAAWARCGRSAQRAVPSHSAPS